MTTPVWLTTKGGVWCTWTVYHTRWWQTMNSNCYQKKTTMQILGLNFKPHSSTYQIHLQAFLEEENKRRKWKPRANVRAPSLKLWQYFLTRVVFFFCVGWSVKIYADFSFELFSCDSQMISQENLFWTPSKIVAFVLRFRAQPQPTFFW